MENKKKFLNNTHSSHKDVLMKIDKILSKDKKNVNKNDKHENKQVKDGFKEHSNFTINNKEKAVFFLKEKRNSINSNSNRSIPKNKARINEEADKKIVDGKKKSKSRFKIKLTSKPKVKKEMKNEKKLSNDKMSQKESFDVIMSAVEKPEVMLAEKPLVNIKEKKKKDAKIKPKNQMRWRRNLK
jgi:hypothetical protein